MPGAAHAQPPPIAAVPAIAGTGRSGRCSAIRGVISRDRAMRHSTRILRIAGQATDSATSAQKPFAAAEGGAA
jgi:hypothetical protein